MDSKWNQRTCKKNDIFYDTKTPKNSASYKHVTTKNSHSVPILEGISQNVGKECWLQIEINYKTREKQRKKLFISHDNFSSPRIVKENLESIQIE